MAGISGRRGVVAACVAVGLVLPFRADAQQANFFRALGELTVAIEGTFGDEGSRIQTELDTLAAALTAWDRQIAATEASLLATPQGASTPNIVARRIALGRQYADRGRFAEALSHLDAASGIEPRRVDVHVLRGLVLRESGRTADAIAAFRTARALDPGNAAAAYALFHELAVSDDATATREAAAAVAAAYGNQPRDQRQTQGAPFAQLARPRTDAAAPPLVPLARYRQAYDHIVRREFEQAIVAFRQAAATDPLVGDRAAGSVEIGRAVGALRQGRLGEARSLLEPAERTDASEVFRVLGLIYWAASDPTRAIAALTTAITRAPRSERARLALSRVLESAGREADAELALQETLRVIPESARARWWLASAYERTNRVIDARQELERAVRSAVSGEHHLHATVGRMASATADFPGAVDAFLRAVHVEPNDPELHGSLGRAFAQLDREDEAIAEFVAALLIDPANAAALAGIGQIHLNAGRIAEAAAVLRRAIELAPADGEARYTFATALMRLGRADEAAEHFARVEQAQRQALADRRRTMSSDVLKEEAALRAAEGQLDAAIALYEQALAVTAEPALYARLADLYARVGRSLDAARARAMQEAALRGASAGQAR